MKLWKKSEIVCSSFRNMFASSKKNYARKDLNARLTDVDTEAISLMVLNLAQMHLLFNSVYRAKESSISAADFSVTRNGKGRMAKTSRR